MGIGNEIIMKRYMDYREKKAVSHVVARSERRFLVVDGADHMLHACSRMDALRLVRLPILLNVQPQGSLKVVNSKLRFGLSFKGMRFNLSALFRLIKIDIVV